MARRRSRTRPDVVVSGIFGLATTFMFHPLSAPAREWADKHLPKDSPTLGPAIAVDRSVIEDTIRGVLAQGLVVALGSATDALQEIDWTLSVPDSLGQRVVPGDPVAYVAHRACRVEFGVVVKVVNEHRVTIRRMDGRTVTLRWAMRLLKLTPEQAVLASGEDWLRRQTEDLRWTR